MISVNGKRALITGASRGIGLLLARFMADQGCNLILHSRRIEHCEALETELRGRGVDVWRVACELGDPASVQAMLDTIDQRAMPVDLVFNNAAVQIAYRQDFWKTPVDDYEQSFRINCIAPAMICYHFMPRMIERGFGRVINTTSGIRDEPEQAGYSASKAALDKITKDLGTKVEGSDVILSLTDPGWCRTDLGGPQAPNDPVTSLPGVAVGAFVNDGKSGRFFHAQDFVGLTLEQAVAKAEGLERID